jgi:leucyl aminopeptidase
MVHLAAVAQLGVPVSVSVVAPLVENMPSAGATRPGDVYKAKNGKFVEVINTGTDVDVVSYPSPPKAVCS